MQRHQRDLGAFVVGISIAHQRRMIEKLIESLAAIARIHGGIHQFAQVLDPRVSLGRVFFFKLLDVTGAVDKEFQNFRRIGRAAGSAKASRLPSVTASVWSRSALARFGLAAMFQVEASASERLRSRMKHFHQSWDRKQRLVLVAIRRARRHLLILASRSLFQPFHIGSGQHGPAIFNQVSKTLQRRQRPLRQKLTLNRLA